MDAVKVKLLVSQRIIVTKVSRRAYNVDYMGFSALKYYASVYVLMEDVRLEKKLPKEVISELM